MLFKFMRISQRWYTYFLCKYSKTMPVFCGGLRFWTFQISEFTKECYLVFSLIYIHVVRSFVFCVMFCKSLFVLLSLFGNWLPSTWRTFTCSLWRSPFVFVLSFVVICTDYIGSCKSTYHATTTYWLICMPFTIILMFALLGCRPLPWVLAKTKTSFVFTSICGNRPPFFVWNLKSFTITPCNHLIKTCWNCTLIKKKKNWLKNWTIIYVFLWNQNMPMIRQQLSWAEIQFIKNIDKM